MQLTALKLNYEKTDNPKIMSHTATWGLPSLGKHGFEGLNTCQHTVCWLWLQLVLQHRNTQTCFWLAQNYNTLNLAFSARWAVYIWKDVKSVTSEGISNQVPCSITWQGNPMISVTKKPIGSVSDFSISSSVRLASYSRHSYRPSGQIFCAPSIKSVILAYKQATITPSSFQPLNILPPPHWMI